MLNLVLPIIFQLFETNSYLLHVASHILAIVDGITNIDIIKDHVIIIRCISFLKLIMTSEGDWMSYLLQARSMLYLYGLEIGTAFNFTCFCPHHAFNYALTISYEQYGHAYLLISGENFDVWCLK